MVVVLSLLAVLLWASPAVATTRLTGILLSDFVAATDGSGAGVLLPLWDGRAGPSWAYFELEMSTPQLRTLAESLHEGIVEITADERRVMRAGRPERVVLTVSALAPRQIECAGPNDVHVTIDSGRRAEIHAGGGAAPVRLACSLAPSHLTCHGAEGAGRVYQLTLERGEAQLVWVGRAAPGVTLSCRLR